MVCFMERCISSTFLIFLSIFLINLISPIACSIQYDDSPYCHIYYHDDDDYDDDDIE